MTNTFPRRSLLARLILATGVAGCASSDRVTGVSRVPAASSQSLVASGSAFSFLPPMVTQPSVTGSFDPAIATLRPQVAICDVTSGPDVACGGSGPGATAAGSSRPRARPPSPWTRRSRSTK